MVIDLVYGLIPRRVEQLSFGGRSPSHFVVKLNEAPVPYVDTVKYLGVFINSRTNCVDRSAALRKFLGCFNNIMSVLGYGRDEMLAVFLAKTYSFFLFYYNMDVRLGTCLLLTSINLMLHGIIVSEKFLMLVGAKVLNRCYFTVANLAPVQLQGAAT